jgi:hypothetical protein
MKTVLIAVLVLVGIAVGQTSSVPMCDGGCMNRESAKPPLEDHMPIGPEGCGQIDWAGYSASCLRIDAKACTITPNWGNLDCHRPDAPMLNGKSHSDDAIVLTVPEGWPKQGALCNAAGCPEPKQKKPEIVNEATYIAAFPEAMLTGVPPATNPFALIIYKGADGRLRISFYGKPFVVLDELIAPKSEPIDVPAIKEKRKEYIREDPFVNAVPGARSACAEFGEVEHDTCADKSRVLLTDEQGGKHCVSFKWQKEAVKP